ncbi:hypothetical protein [Gemmatimonas sp.]
MIDHATPVAPSDTRFGPDRTNFLTSHRAQSVGAREFSKLAESLVALAKRAAAGSASEPPITRLSPDRCIVQLGPVALTVAHIRTGNDVPPGGQLLAIIWNGTIAPRGDHVPERSARHVPPPPVSVWEESLVVSAAAETSWHWHPNGVDSTGYTSPELAERCIIQLQSAFETALRENPDPAPLS